MLRGRLLGGSGHDWPDLPLPSSPINPVARHGRIELPRNLPYLASLNLASPVLISQPSFATMITFHIVVQVIWLAATALILLKLQR
ncbi:hypothetical protein [Luteolibacter luteus]|uniref:Uncharacterized protein n=1 Tax=Luteolibacter luteus TaxID=2728835 RepID=A0A858RDI5_9BACT|nr:hypothetical protein [Luteolibacter luteus]QJE94380.1 hypothetical protein HHL09_00790 [Luteolibacter luteus]